MKNSDHKNKEKALLLLLSRGDRIAFQKLYQRHLPTLHRFILPFTGHDHTEADRIVQDVFVKIWERREKLAHITSFESYLFRMAKNRLFDLHKQRRSRMALTVHLATEQRTPSAHEHIVYEEYMESARSIIEELTPQRKRIFLMRTQTQMSIAEIACALKISKSAVKKQLYESIRIVKRRMNKEHDWPLMWWILWLSMPILM